MNIALTIIEGICVLGLMVVSILTGIKIGIKKVAKNEIEAIYYKHMTKELDERLKETEVAKSISSEERRTIKEQIDNLIKQGYPIEHIKCIINIMWG